MADRPQLRLTRALHRAARSCAASMMLLSVAFWIAAAASYAGFMAKWAFHDGRDDFGIEVILDRSGERPYVYRQLLPLLSFPAERLVPDGMKPLLIEKLHPQRFYARVQPVSDTNGAIRYLAVYYMSFLALFASLFCLRRAALDAGASAPASVAASVAFALVLPYLQTIGGFYYDSVELFFLAVACLVALRGRVLLLVLLAVPATLNKEAFLFFVPALYPLLRMRLAPRSAWVGVAGMLLAAAAVNAVVKIAFADARGGPAIFQLVDNLARYARPTTYLLLENTYGLIGPRGVSVLTLALAAIIALRGWPGLPPHFRAHAIIAAAINVPLFVAFAATGELRNLSFLFVTSVLLIALAIDRTLVPQGAAPR